METVFHFRDDKRVYEAQDWSTSVRLALFNALAKEALSNTTLATLLAFDSTRALSTKTCDSVHFTAAGAMAPQISQLVDILHCT